MDFGGLEMRTNYLLAALPLTCLFAANAFAQGACTKPLALASDIQMTSSNGGPSSVPVKINGTDQTMTLATAGITTQISETSAKALNLKIERADGVLLADEFGGTSRDEATIPDFSVGRLHLTNVKWPISIGGGRGGSGRGGAGGSVGLLSLNYLAPFDVDVDFGSDKLRFFNQDHCPGGVLYWQAPGPVGVVPLAMDGRRVTAQVMVNGKPITAVIDTASPTSSLRATVATKVLGVELGGAKAPAKSGGLGGQNYTWTVDTLAFNALKTENVALTVLPDINAGNQDHGDGAVGMRRRAEGIQYALDHPEIILGMDVLRKYHLFLSFAEKRLYVTGTANTLPAASTAAAPAAAAAP